MVKCYLSASKYKLLATAYVLALCLVRYTLLATETQANPFSMVLLSLVLSIPIFVFLFFMLKEIYVTDTIFWGAALMACCFYCWAIERPAIAFDTWQVYDMSRYIVEDFGYMSMIRQHIINSHYEMAFPPMFPFLLAMINSILDMGIMSSILLNFLCCLMLIALFKSIGDYLGQSFAFSISLLMFVCTSLFWGIFRGGLTQLLGFTLFAIIMRLLVKRDFSERDNYLAALTAGIGLMNRFDFVAITGIITVLTPLRVNVFADRRGGKIKLKNRIIWLLINFIIVIMVCLPWIGYSAAKFGKVFVTDNGRRLINIADTRPSTYFPAEAPALTIFDDFSAWIIAFRERASSSFNALKILMSNYYLFKHFAIFLLCVLVVMICCFMVKEKFRFVKRVCLLTKKQFSMFIVAFSVICQELLIICTGYDDLRYHILFLFLINTSLLVLFKVLLIRGYQRSEKQNDYKKLPIRLIGLIGCILLVYDGFGMLWDNLSKVFSQRYSGEVTTAIATTLNEQERAIDGYLYGQHASCVVIDRKEPTINIPRTCSLIHTAAILSPSNITQDNAGYFVRDFQIDYLFSSDQELVDIFSSTVGITETSVEHLYKLGIE